jgi:arylsulfatase A
MLGDHNPSGPYRGGKYSAYEAGTRVPTITYWPGRINPGESAALLTQVDLYASLAELVNEETGDKVIDSQNHLEAWLGQSSSGREIMLEESFTLSLRDGKWKYIQPHTGSIPDFKICTIGKI